MSIRGSIFRQFTKSTQNSANRVQPYTQAMSSGHQNINISLSRIIDDTKDIIEHLRSDVQESYRSGIITSEQKQQLIARLGSQETLLWKQKEYVESIAVTDIDYSSPSFQTSTAEARSYSNRTVY